MISHSALIFMKRLNNKLVKQISKTSATTLNDNYAVCKETKLH